MIQFSARRTRRAGAMMLPVALLLAVTAHAAAPKITGTPSSSATVGVTYRFTPAASDGDRNTLTYSVVNRPGWMSFSGTTGVLTGAPYSNHIGTYSGIVISVSDGSSKVSLPSLSIVVKANSNKSPVLSGTPSTTAKAGVAYSFQPSGKDPEGKALTWRVLNKPSWASFSTSTGGLSGTPVAAGTFAGIYISATDGVSSTALSTFAITVSTSNSAPTITGSPVKTAKVGTPYTFTPAASDSNHDALTFSIANKPSWASFSATTGQLTGMPTAAGTASNILIGVGDGKATASLAAFSIVVSPASTGLPGSVTVSWLPPTQYTDGSTLTNLAGYRIRYGKSASARTTVVNVPNAGLANSVIEGLAPGVWYFTVTAFTSEGAESDDSTVASATIG